jgi:hypothetical protein
MRFLFKARSIPAMKKALFEHCDEDAYNWSDEKVRESYEANYQVGYIEVIPVLMKCIGFPIIGYLLFVALVLQIPTTPSDNTCKCQCSISSN